MPILSGDEIKKYGLVESIQSESLGVASYDLTVGEIISAEGKYVPEAKVEPGGVVQLVSRETIELPENIIAFAHVKTAMTRRGLQALGVGIIDPGWSGPISSILVNFGDDKNKRVDKGKEFLRLTFYKIEEPNKNVSLPEPIERVDYLEAVRKDIEDEFGNSFLNIDKQIQEAIHIAPSQFGKYLGIAAIIFAALQIFAAWIIYYDPLSYQRNTDIERVVRSYEQVTNETLRNDTESQAVISSLGKQQSDLSNSVEALQSIIDGLLQRISKQEEALQELRREGMSQESREAADGSAPSGTGEKK